MKDIRIGNDILVTWSLFRGEDAYDLTNLPVTLYLKNAYGKKKVENYAVNGNQISWTFYGKDQKNTGKYSMVLVIREGKQGMASTDYCDFVQLVSCACQVSGMDEENVQTETLELNSEVDFPPIIVDTSLSEVSGNPIANMAVAKAFATQAESIKNKVDKVEGKGLSSNDFTNALREKLLGLENYNDAEISSAVEKLSRDFEALLGNNASAAIESFNEIIAFLEGIEDSASLDAIVASIQREIARVSNGLADTDAKITNLSEEHNDLNYEVNATPYVMIGKYSTTTVGNKLSFIDYAPRSSTRLIPRYSDKFTIVGVDSIYDIIFLDKDNIVTRRGGTIRIFNEGEVAMVVIFVNENNPNGYSQLRVLQGVTLTENLKAVYKDIDISSVMSGNSIQDVILDGYYDSSGNFVPNSTYKALPLLPNFNDSLFIDLDKWKVVSFGVRCLDSEKKYIGDAVRNASEIGKIRYDALDNTAYYGVYWNPKDAAEDYSKHFILGLEYPQLYNLLTKANGGEENGGEEIDAEKLSLIDSIPLVNMYNPNDVDAIVGAYIDNGDILNSASYDTSGYIAVKENTTYYNAVDSARSYRFVNFFDSSKKFLSQVQDVTGLNLNSFTTPAGCAYIRVSVYANYERTHFVAEKEVNYTPYSPQLGTDGKKVATIDEVGNTLYGKKWCVVGDSFSADFPKGYADDWYYDNGTSKVYGRLIAERNKMSLQWMAAGGRTIATPSDGSFTNAFSLDLYKNIDADVDYITIYLGINDSHHAPGSSGDDGEDKSGEIPLGTINDTTNATFYGAWNVVIPYLIEKHPFAHIGIIVSNGCDTEEYREAEIAIAKKYGIPYIDLNGDERTPCMIRSKNPNITQSIRNLRTLAQAIDYDGSITGTPNSHPNKAAHEYESMFIENFLRSL